MTDVMGAARLLEEAAFAPETFPDALAAVARMLGANELSLVNASDEVPAIIQSTNMTGDMQRQYLTEGWYKIDIRHKALVRAGSTQGVVVSEQQLVPDAIRQRSAFYQEYCKTFDLAHCSSWSYMLDGEGWGYSLLHGKNAGSPDAADLLRLQQIAPHAIRAGMLATRFHMTRAKGIAEGLGRASKPAVVIDHRGLCVFATSGAEQLFDNTFGLKGARLWAADAPSNARLEQLSDAARSPYRSVRPKQVTVHRHGHARPLLLAPVPFSGRALDAWPSARLVVMIVDLGRSPQPSHQLVREAFSLTPSEARIALALGEGCSAPEIAERFSIKVSTVRQQIKSVLAKADVKRQSELVALLSRLPGAS